MRDGLAEVGKFSVMEGLKDTGCHLVGDGEALEAFSCVRWEGPDLCFRAKACGEGGYKEEESRGREPSLLFLANRDGLE